MKWGRKKPSLNSSSSSKSSPFSSRVPFLSHVLPSSWLSKFKRGVDTQPKAAFELREMWIGSCEEDHGSGENWEVWQWHCLGCEENGGIPEGC